MSFSCLSQAKHANGGHSWGINGETGKIEDMKKYGLYESAGVKVSLRQAVADAILRVGTVSLTPVEFRKP
jgi:chaperonin GroEL (HSP60 family)